MVTSCTVLEMTSIYAQEALRYILYTILNVTIYMVSPTELQFTSTLLVLPSDSTQIKTSLLNISLKYHNLCYFININKGTASNCKSREYKFE